MKNKPDKRKVKCRKNYNEKTKEGEGGNTHGMIQIYVFIVALPYKLSTGEERTV